MLNRINSSDLDIPQELKLDVQMPGRTKGYLSAFSDKMEGVNAFNSEMISGFESCSPQTFNPQVSQHYNAPLQGSFGDIQHGRSIETGLLATTHQENEPVNASPKLTLLLIAVWPIQST